MAEFMEVGIMLEKHSFQEVMRQFDRMCRAHAGCIDCPLAAKGTIGARCSIGSFIDESEYVEREIMSWAAQHPEPVYETWLQFVKRFETGKPKNDKDFIYWMGTTSIPADMAQKLGIEPKEKT